MSTTGLPAGAFLTTLEGRRCTAVPRAAANVANTANIAVASAAPTIQSFSVQTIATTSTAADFAAADGADTNTAAAETSSSSSTSTTSSPLAIITNTVANPAPELAQATQAEDVAAVPPAPVSTSPPPAVLPPEASSTLPTSTDTPPTQQAVPASAVIQTSQADNSITASVADQVAVSPATALPDVSASPVLTESSAAAPLFTTIGTAPAPTDNPAAAGTNTGSTNSAVSAVPNPNSNAAQTTVAVAGGVIGGVVAISIVAFVIWWWRRRVMRKRRSTLLTPLDAQNAFDRGEKGAYVINRGSIGPTPIGEKFRAAFGYKIKKIRGRVSQLVTRNSGSKSVNLDRGNSQFMDPVNTHSRASSSTSSHRAEATTNDRFGGWWTRLTAGMNFNGRTRSNGPDKGSISTPSSIKEKKGFGSQPDFLTLLGMDERELDQEAQRRRASISRKNGSAGSADHFLGALNLNFGSSTIDNPFSDANALAHSSAQPAPLAFGQPGNPFSDANAIRDPPAAMSKPSTYVADMRRSRGQSVSANGARQPSTVYNRDSAGSVESFQGRRNKFRSDPFDLERPELLAGARAAKNSITSSTGGTAGSEPRASRISGGVGTGDIRRPAGAHTRSESFTSKYSSGVSMGDWSDPGPDVGPAATRWDGPEPRASPTQGWRDRMERDAAVADGSKRQSGGSQKSVGKAM